MLGLAVGIAFIIVFASFLQATPRQIRSIEPASMSAVQEQIRFGNKVQVDATSHGFDIWQLALSDKGILYITGGETVPPPASGHRDNNYLVYLTKSEDGGATFDNTLHMSNSIYSGNPDVKIRGESVYLMWFEHILGDDSEIFFRKSADGGSSFGPVVNVSGSPYSSGQNDMEVSKDGNVVYAVWSEFYQYSEPKKSAILFTSSRDGGQNFGPPVALINGTNFACPQIAISENNSRNDMNVYVVWRQHPGSEDTMTIFFSVSHDGGRTFGEPVRLRTAYMEDFRCPHLVVRGTDAYLMWSEAGHIRKPYSPSEILAPDSDVIFTAIRDEGRKIAPALNLSRGIGAFTTEPEMLVADDGDIYVVWRDTIPIIDHEDGSINYYGNAEVVFTKSNDGGRTFSNPVNLSNNLSGSYEPEIAVHGDDIYIIWLESEFPFNAAETMLRISNDGGDSFGNTISGITGRMEEPVSRPVIISSYSGDRVFIAWSERPDFNDLNSDAYVLVGYTRE